MLLLDYIGNRGVRLPRESSSNPQLVEGGPRGGRAASASARSSRSPPRPRSSTTTPRSCAAGVPAVDLIDWSYPVRDTIDDTYDQLSARAIDAVGETVVELLRT